MSSPIDFEQEDEVLGDDVAGGAGRVGAAADAALRGVEGGHAGIERRHHVGEALPARVVQMRAAGLVAELGAQAREQPPHLRRVGVADGVGEADGVGAGLAPSRRHPITQSSGTIALDGAAEGGGDADLDLRPLLRGQAVAQRARSRATSAIACSQGLADVGHRCAPRDAETGMVILCAPASNASVAQPLQVRHQRQHA